MQMLFLNAGHSLHTSQTPDDIMTTLSASPLSPRLVLSSDIWHVFTKSAITNQRYTSASASAESEGEEEQEKFEYFTAINN